MKLKSTLLASTLLAVMATQAFAETKEISIINCGADTDPTAAVQKEEIDAWLKDNPDYTVKEEYVGWDQCQDKTMNLAGAGTPPAIAYLGSRTLKQLASNELIVPIEMSQEELDSYEDSIRRTMSFDGKVWGLPRAFSTKALFWNKGLFEEAGVSGPPETWDDVMAAAKAITENTDAQGIGLAAASMDNTMHQFLNWLYSNGGNVINDAGEIEINSPNTVAAFQLYKDLLPYAEDGPTAYDRAELEPLFAGGQVAMYINGGWGRAPERVPADSEWGVAAIPAGPDGTHSTLLITDSLVVFKESGVTEGAMSLAKFLTSPERQARFDEVGGWTPIRTGEGSDALVAKDPTWAVFIDAIPTGGPEPLLTDYVATQDAFTEAIQGVILDEITPEEAAEQLAEELEDIK